MTKVLVVEDEEMVRKSVMRILVRSGFECDEAADGAEATRLLDVSDEYAAALCDIRMPGESGLHLARRLAADHPDIAVVMMTGEDDPETANEAFEIGAFGYLTKPFTANGILIALSAALRRRELEQLRVAQNRNGGREITPIACGERDRDRYRGPRRHLGDRSDRNDRAPLAGAVAA